MRTQWNLNTVLYTVFSAVLGVAISVAIHKLDASNTTLIRVETNLGMVLQKVPKIEDKMNQSDSRLDKIESHEGEQDREIGEIKTTVKEINAKVRP